MTGVLTVGESMALVGSSRPEPLHAGATMTLGMGGAESNVAIGLRRLGTAATWVGRLGEDSAGDLVEKVLRGEGVTTRALRTRDVPTGLMLKEQRSTMETRIWYYRAGSAGSRLRPGDVTAQEVAEADLVHLTGITSALSASARDLVLDTARLAADAGVPVSFDLNYRSRLWDEASARALYARIVPQCAIVFGGLEEVEILIGPETDPVRAGHALRALGAGIAVVKLGAQGAVAVWDGGEVRVPAVPVQVRDTVGAGDAFVAGFLADHLAGNDVATALATAASVGAYACTGDGDWETLPTRADLRRLGGAEPVTR
ncbi:sugar kinase [Serinibacter salmoneus]|uniref:2-dehydro-3-deoxygluconokinase n=1 Tax=Serinibacter salmoneus TaxID=556530 RepID=A0A2A9CYS1_9MICO|nr:sugar kinase [Serinibacter salmoneus]PFG19588.1 2-dehydro-3-deoxygluconokinase [Serinibacter salmoneus]